MDEKLHGLFGIARKAGVLRVGQDAVRAELRKGTRLMVVLTRDHSSNVRSMIEGYRRRGACRVIVSGSLGREELGRLLSTGQTQIVGLPLGNGLSGKIEKLVAGEVDSNEQDQGL
ncbi:MAG: hypothetical protein WBJ42_01620 [Thermovirgaceae bacterium]|nr:hypothetical protein [Synergistales bacterium]HPC75190.1 hypothetical protein [Synergistales bacterium]HRS48338.1 hypothetical protein [Thermovirgaceae bacterium]HRU90432.1 hypothetical protein [Thermovirgaceae bacterium]